MNHSSIFFLVALSMVGLSCSITLADGVTDDEAAIAIHIEALHDENIDVRAAAAAALREIVAKYPGGTTNIRSPDGGKAHWSKKVEQIRSGTKKAVVRKVLPPFAKSPGTAGAWSGQSHTEFYRLDYDWIVTVQYYNPDTVIEHPRLDRKEMKVFVAPPAKYTGTWTCWHVNGQKAHETQYLDGQYDGASVAYHDNGKISVEQHYVNHAANGADTGWYADGAKSYAGQYLNGKQVGHWVHWYPNGQKQSESKYNKQGRLRGLHSNWYESGQQSLEVHYRDGVKHGIEAAWNEQGVLQYRREVKNGSVPAR